MRGRLVYAEHEIEAAVWGPYMPCNISPEHQHGIASPGSVSPRPCRCLCCTQSLAPLSVSLRQCRGTLVFDVVPGASGSVLAPLPLVC